MKFSFILRRVGGTMIFILGVVSLVLPVLPGWLLIGVGLYFLSFDSPGMQSRIRALRIRYPRFHAGLSHIERILKIKIGGEI